MGDDNSRSLDVLGVKPIADAASHVTRATIDGAGALLSRICLPAAEELGYLLQDKVRAWRQKNTVRILRETQAKFDKYGISPDVHAHPRLVAAVLQQGSWSDDKLVQELWAGLLASACDKDGRDESNLIFTALLSELTALQARILRYTCEKTVPYLTPAGLIMPQLGLVVDVDTLKGIAEDADLHRIDIELDRLHALGLIQLGFNANGSYADITATALALNMYARCQGFKGSAVEYYGLSTAGKPP